MTDAQDKGAAVRRDEQFVPSEAVVYSHDAAEAHVTIDELMEYVEAVSPRLTCSVCSNSAFGPMSINSQGRGAAVFRRETPETFFSSFGIICDHCGNIYDFYAGHVVRWVADRRRAQT